MYSDNTCINDNKDFKFFMHFFLKKTKSKTCVNM